MAGRDVPGHHPRDDVRKFVAWLKPYLHLWTTVEVTAWVAKPHDTWIALRCRCLLASAAAASAENFGTERLKVVRKALPIGELPAILEQIGQGWLAADSTPLGMRIRLEDADGVTWQRVSGWPRDAAASEIGGSTSRFLRYEIEFETQAALERDLGPGNGYAWLSEERACFEGAGNGGLIGHLRKLGLTAGVDHMPDLRTFRTTLVAPVPLRLDEIGQSNDRHTVAVTVLAAATVRLDQVHVMLDDSDPAHLTPHRASPDSHGHVAFQTVAPGKANVSVAYLGKVIDGREVEVHPVQRRSARTLALDAFERTPSLIAKGLRQEGAADSDGFERAVAHLLGLLGFSPMWWGTNRMKSGVPQDQADILAFAPHDGAVLVVDATIEPNKDPKVAKLIGRARDLEQTLRRELGDDTFVALPVLAVAVGQRVVPQGWLEHEVEILTGEKLWAALEALRQGVPIEQICVTLSSRIHDVLLRPGRQFSIW